MLAYFFLLKLKKIIFVNNMETLGDKIQPKFSQNSALKYCCEYCDYKTSKKCNYDTHIMSAKHLRITNDYNMGQNSAKIQPKEKFICSCGKEYHYRQGLWKHSKNCISEKDDKSHIETHDKKDELIMMLVKQNSELIKEHSDVKQLILEIAKNGTHNTTNNNNNTHTNSHNKTFNLQVFLNETCKDAMNIMDFVDSIKLQLSDLEKVGEIGYVEGISNIIVKNLNELDVNKRPVHCTDQKRETMYIKDDDKWEKDEEKLKLHKVVRKVTCKNQNLIHKFKEEHPDYNKYHSKISDKYNKIVVESMGGPGDNDFEKEDKIIKNISKNVIIEK
jgi:hypothetical protein